MDPVVVTVAVVTITLGIISLAVGAILGIRAGVLKSTNEMLSASLEQTRRELHELHGRVDAMTGEFAVDLATKVTHETIRIFEREGVIPPHDQRHRGGG